MMARFCSVEFKVRPMRRYVRAFMKQGFDVTDWSGIRAEEGLKRSQYEELELYCTDRKTGARAWHYRPLLQWKEADVFAMIKRHGLKLNPLYEAGFKRVGCFPCVNCRKDEIRLIAEKFPERIDELRRWEALVAKTSPLKQATFFVTRGGKTGIDDYVEWSKTDRKKKTGKKNAEVKETETPA